MGRDRGGAKTPILAAPDGWAYFAARSFPGARSAPADAGSALPPSVTGGGMWGTGTGDIGTLITVSAPAGYFFGGVINEGKAVRPGDVIESGFPSSTTRINLSPGQSESAQFRFIAPQPGSADPVILHTPLLTQPEVALMPSGCR